MISCTDLLGLLEEKTPPFLLDVMPKEEFQAGHISGAENACVYEITFLDAVAKLLPNADQPVVVYDSGPNNLASTTAASKLRGAGYTDVSELSGGLKEWQAKGHPVTECIANLHSTSLIDGIHQFDLSKSVVTWHGRNLTTTHSGTVNLRSGRIEILHGEPGEGSFSLDMTSIKDTDLGDSSMSATLVHHLLSDDFFDVAHFPQAIFILSKATRIENAKAGNPNYEILGELRLKGVLRQIVFPAIIASTSEGLLAADAHFDINRTHWNVLYGSGRFYEKLGKHLVDDEISLDLKLITC
jgi:rhodanese-related sulfurtransferase